VTRGIAFAFLGYALFTLGDAAVKVVGNGLSPFQIAFTVALTASIAIDVTKPRDEAWSAALTMRRPRLVLLRAAMSSVSWVAGIFAFTTIPFAEAFALLFLAPSMAALLSWKLLGERLDARGWAAVALGFAGVVIAIRPGMRELAAGHAAAALAAFTVAGSLVLLRRITALEARTTIMVVTTLMILAVTGTAMIPSFRWPSGVELGWLVVSGILDGFGQICLLVATRIALAGLIGAAQYSQLFWAVLIGMLFFDERPDAGMVIGLAAILGSGLLAVASARR
jgi:drug/metabolite transporter (DMT)-like permease